MDSLMRMFICVVYACALLDGRQQTCSQLLVFVAQPSRGKFIYFVTFWIFVFVRVSFISYPVKWPGIVLSALHTVLRPRIHGLSVITALLYL